MKVRLLDIASASFAFLAAFFWFLSAYGKLPQNLIYLGSDPEADPFYSAIKYSAGMNTWAAVLSGCSALCIFLKVFFPN